LVKTSVVASIFLASASAAQAQGPADRFAGFHAGLAAGVSQTYFVVETLAGGTAVEARGVKAWGGAISGFLGYDFAVSPSFLLGVGAELNDAGATARFESGRDFASITPQWGYTLTARAGYAVNDALLLYGRGAAATSPTATAGRRQFPPSSTIFRPGTAASVLRLASKAALQTGSAFALRPCTLTARATS